MAEGEKLQERNHLSPQESITKEPWEREVDGIYFASGYIQQKARGKEEGGLDRDDLLMIHKIVINDPLNPEKTGRIREVPVRVWGKMNGQVMEAAFTPADTTFLSEYFNEFASELEQMTSQLSIDTPVEKVIEVASWAHWRFIEIHPFEDGNGRTARLIVDFIFKKVRLPVIRDWGAAKDEYNTVVYRIYAENDLNLLKLFFAQKLKLRLGEVDLQYAPKVTNGQDFQNYIKNRLVETEDYIKKLS